MLERFLLAKDPSGLLDKSREIDKIDYKSVSFFAALAQDPTTTSVLFLGGFAYIDKTFVNVVDTVVGLGVGGSHQVGAVPPNFYNTAWFSLSKTGAILKVEGTAAATAGAVVDPVGGFPSGSIPICKILFRDNGVGGIGTILPISQSDITDVRGFFFGNYGKATFATEVINDFKVQSLPVPNRTVTVETGNLYFNSGEYAELLSQQVMDFGPSAPFQSPTMLANYYNKGLICLTTFGTLIVVWGTSAVTANAVALGPLPKDAFPLAIVTVQDDGSGGPGTINAVQSSHIKDVRPFFNNFFGQLPTENLSYCRVKAHFPPDQQVNIADGMVYPQGILYNFAALDIDFQNPGPYQIPASPPGQYRKVLLGINSAGLVYFDVSAPALTPGALVDPLIPPTIIPLAFVTVRDDSSGLAGTILPVEPSDIQDIRPFLGALGSSGSSAIIQKNKLHHGFLEESFFKQGYFESFVADDNIDLPNTTADVDVLIDNQVVLEPGEVVTSKDVFDSFYSLVNIENTLVLAEASSLVGLVAEASNDGGATWEVVNIINPNPASFHTFTSAGTDLRVRFTNTSGGDITLTSWGVFYNSDPMVPSYMSYVLDDEGKLTKILTAIKDNAYVNTLNINQLAGDLYKDGTAELLNNGNKTLAPSYSFQGLLSSIKAVVGPDGTHTTLASAIADVPAGSLIVIDSTTLALAGTVNVNKPNLTIMGCGRGTVISGNDSFVGFNVTAEGVKIKGCKFLDFTTAVLVASENCMIVENYFESNTLDVDYSGVTAIVVEGNISE